jgi:ABC-type sugar transport system permease subunit
MARFALTYRSRRTLEAYMLLLPWLIGFIAFVAWPIGHSFFLSFQMTRVTGTGWQYFYVGLENYLEALVKDPRVVPMFTRTFWRMVTEVPIMLVFSLGAALLINQRVPGRAIFRVIFFVPVVLLAGTVVREIFWQGAGTLPALRTFDIPGLLGPYLSAEAIGRVMEVLNRIVLVLWKSGVQILIFLAGLQGISATLYEASRVDGASAWESFWHVTLPIITPVILLNIIYSIVDSFTDPLNEVMHYIQNQAFKGGWQGSFQPGYAAAIGWLYFVLIFGILTVVFIWAKQWVFYAGEKR